LNPATMIESEVVIVGGGPAGSTCAWQLHQHGISTIVLDKARFPRDKLCAGWITPRVVSQLKLEEDRYPHSLKKFSRIEFSFFGKKLPLRTKQYAIRRIEFDDWLLKRSGVAVHHHHVNGITEQAGGFVIDGKFRCRYLVGAGGTNCPVYRTLFKPFLPRTSERLIVTLEKEFPSQCADQACRLWFFENRLPGYSWFVPKGNGYVNVGIGAKYSSLHARGENIRDHWRTFVNKLSGCSLVDMHNIAPRGYAYYLRQPHMVGRKGNVFLTGDSAGLASLDMGEGIGPAVESGLMAARSIITGQPYRPEKIRRFSAVDILLPNLKNRQVPRV